jgi:hypothetical protein
LSRSATNVHGGGTFTTGGVVSTTETSNEALTAEPELSTAVQLTGVVPSANREPEGRVHETTSGPSTVSEAEGAGAYVTFAPVGPVASTVCLAGTAIVGAASVTDTVNVPEALLPAASRALHETVVRPIRNVDPDAGVHVTARGPSTASFAEALNDTARPAALVASTVMSAGTMTVGAAASRTMTVNVRDPEFP